MEDLSVSHTFGAARSKEQVALELMKFVALTTGYGKGAPSTAYTGKASRAPEEYADTPLELY